MTRSAGLAVCAALVFGLAARVACAGPTGPAIHALRADDIVLDFSPAAEILQLWRDRPATMHERAQALARDVPYRTLRDFLTTQMSCVATDGQIAGSIVAPDSAGVCGFGLDPAWRERAALDSLLATLVKKATSIRAHVARDAGAYVPRADWKPVRVYFVLASRWLFDAVTVDRGPGGSPAVVLFNLSEALGYGGNTRERAAVVERVLAHETFHATLRQIEIGRPGWARYYSPMNAFDRIARVMLDEGVAHYIDWKGRPEADSLFTTKPGQKEKRAFDQLALACRRLHDPATDPGAREEILGLASTGPIWSKYGAISGMFGAWRIERAMGADSLRAVVLEGPAAFLRRYATVAAEDSSLKRLPRELSPQ